VFCQADEVRFFHSRSFVSFRISKFCPRRYCLTCTMQGYIVKSLCLRIESSLLFATPHFSRGRIRVFFSHVYKLPHRLLLYMRNWRKRCSIRLFDSKHSRSSISRIISDEDAPSRCQQAVRIYVQAIPYLYIASRQIYIASIKNDADMRQVFSRTRRRIIVRLLGKTFFTFVNARIREGRFRWTQHRCSRSGICVFA